MYVSLLWPEKQFAYRAYKVTQINFFLTLCPKKKLLVCSKLFYFRFYFKTLFLNKLYFISVLFYVIVKHIETFWNNYIIVLYKLRELIDIFYLIGWCGTFFLVNKSCPVPFLFVWFWMRSYQLWTNPALYYSVMHFSHFAEPQYVDEVASG